MARSWPLGEYGTVGRAEGLCHNSACGLQPTCQLSQEGPDLGVFDFNSCPPLIEEIVCSRSASERLRSDSVATALPVLCSSSARTSTFKRTRRCNCLIPNPTKRKLWSLRLSIRLRLLEAEVARRQQLLGSPKRRFRSTRANSVPARIRRDGKPPAHLAFERE
jgi:hypothetical protein